MACLEWFAVFCGIFFCLFAGCRNDSVAFHEAVPVTRQLENGDAAARQPKYRMITAIADRSEETWFFKISGPLDNVARIQESWTKFLESIRFDKDEPVWELPEGWSSEGIVDRAMSGFSMRMGDVDTGDDQVAVSVSSMPGSQRLLPNVNRWRGQLGLPPTNEVALFADLEDFSSGELKFKVFDARGPELKTRMGGAPFAQGGAPFAQGRPKRPPSPHSGLPPDGMKSTAKEPAAARELDFTAPDGWKAGNRSSMILGRWTRETAAGSPELILMAMRSTDESWKMNVAEWARQVQLKESPDVAEITEQIEVAGQPARKVTLSGPRQEQLDEHLATVAVMFQHPSGSGYVVKLMGNQTSVDEAMDDFDSFLKSISFPTDHNR